MTDLLRSVDIYLSLPKNYANKNYTDHYYAHLRQLLRGKRILYSSVRLSQLSMFFLLSFALLPLIILLKLLGYRFIDIDLDQIGSVLYLDLLLKEDALDTNTPKNKMFALSSNYTDANQYLLNLYSVHITFVRHPLLKVLLAPLFISPLFKNDSSYRFDNVNFTENVSHKIWNQYNKKFNGPLISMPEKDKIKCETIISDYIPPYSKFVILHVRDNGYYEIDKQNLRNADIFTYKKAINYLIQKGYYVIRVGDPNMVKIDELLADFSPYLFDYAHSNIKSEMMDTYIFSNCAYQIGCTSGPAHTAAIFGKNLIGVNWFNAATASFFTKGDITTIKKFRYTDSGELVPFSKILQPPFITNITSEQMEREGVYLEDNSEEEILDTIIEFETTKNHGSSKRQERAQSMLTEAHNGYGASGLFSNTILKIYNIGNSK